MWKNIYLKDLPRASAIVIGAGIFMPVDAAAASPAPWDPPSPCVDWLSGPDNTGDQHLQDPPKMVGGRAYQVPGQSLPEPQSPTD